MSRSFEVKLTGNPDEVIAKARTLASANGVDFSGDRQTGHFSGHGIEGSYLIMDDILSVNIARKPLILPWTLVESTLRKYFS